LLKAFCLDPKAGLMVNNCNVKQLSQTEAQIKVAAKKAGFDVCGIAPVGGNPELAYFSEWIAAGHAGEMRYLKSRNDAGELKRSSLQAAAPWARSVVVCAINYNSDQPYSTEYQDKSRGWISRYAWGQQDYHELLLARLRTLEQAIKETSGEKDFRSWCYVDTGPIVERVLAKYAGVGWQGKNTCIINQEMGSWLFLGVILTSIELTPDLPAPDRCGSCTRCLDACPTDAFVAPYKLDASRCISYLTIEKRGSIPEELRAAMGNHIFGCDICQDVCPWNREAAVSQAAEFLPSPELVNPALAWLAEMTSEDFRATFKGSPVKRAKHSGLRRNAAIAMGNSGDPTFVPQLEKLADDEDDSVAEHARWALERLKAAGVVTS
jgi:epoxyqueuosine reductase